MVDVCGWDMKVLGVAKGWRRDGEGMDLEFQTFILRYLLAPGIGIWRWFLDFCGVKGKHFLIISKKIELYIKTSKSECVKFWLRNFVKLKQCGFWLPKRLTRSSRHLSATYKLGGVLSSLRVRSYAEDTHTNFCASPTCVLNFLEATWPGIMLFLFVQKF